MAKKWLKEEGPKWVEKDIISNEQYEQIVALYSKQNQGLNILSILGSVLVGLGILSFIAANWQEIPTFIRLGLVIAIMSGFYIGGSMFYNRGNENTGIALFGLGFVSFGAGIFLIAQMYHLTSNSVLSFIIWSIVGLALWYSYGSRYLFILTAIVLNIAQFYSAMNFYEFNYFVLLLTFFGLGYGALRTKDRVAAGLVSASVIIQSIIWIAERETSFFWVILALGILYVIGDLIREQMVRAWVQIMPLIMAFAVAAWFTFMDFPFTSLNDIIEELNVYVFVPILIVLFLASFLLKYRRGKDTGQDDTYSLADWILFLPVFLIGQGTDWFYLIMLFAYALFVLLDGYRDHSHSRVNIGTLLFLFVTLLAYVKLTWGFMDKSLVFISGGIVLFALSWFLNRRRKALLDGAGGKKA